MTPLGEARAQVHIENMEHSVTRKKQVGAEATPSFPVPPGEVIIPADLHGKTAQRHIAISSAVKNPVLAKTLPVAAQLGGYRACLVEFRGPISHIQNFLNRDNVGVQPGNNFRDSLRIGTPVQTPAFVNVVSGNAEAEIHCSRSTTQPTISRSRSD